jgi:tRNA-intron lyase
MAVEEGWAVLCGPVLGDPTTATAGNDSRNKKRKATSGRYHYTIDEDDDADDEDFDDDGYYYQHHGEDNDEEEAEKKKNSAPWQNALAKGTPFEIPTTAEEALVAQGGRSDADNKNAASNTTTTTTNCEKIVKRADVHWTFPSTKEQRDRYLIFKDLHSRGFRITGGSKFGSDYLLYPGDPTLYHAQFCVRLVQFKESILPALMASACRGSFQARKHLLYASAVMKNEQGEILVEDAWNNDDDDDDDVFKMLRKIRGKYETQYMTFGPVDGFGKD